MSESMKISGFLPRRIKEYMEENGFFDSGFYALQEIRLRVNCPLIVVWNNEEKVFENIEVASYEIQRLLELVSEYSLYVYKEDIKNGYITVQGGHRVGVMGQVIMDERGVANQKNISFVNIRVAHEVKDCALPVMDFVCKGGKIKNTLIVSPPGCGKTTLLRDIVRTLSNGYRGISATVSVIDERSEIAAGFNGVPQNDVGIRTDVIDGIKKSDGIIMAVRSMAPDIIAVDELGANEDFEAVRKALYSGCYCIATAHGFDLQGIMHRQEFKDIIGVDKFERIIVLARKGRIGRIEKMIDLSQTMGGGR